MKQSKLERTQDPVSLSRKSSTAAYSHRQSLSYNSRITRSQAVFSSIGKTTLPMRASSSLPRLPATSRVRPHTELLASWMARSSDPLHMSQLEYSATAKQNSPGSAGGCGTGKPNKASLLRSKTCPLPLPQSDLTEIHRKQKMFARRYKTYSASFVSSHTLPSGETSHGFLTGARYNGALTLDTHCFVKYGVYVSKRDISKAFLNRLGSKPPSHKVYGNCHEVEGSHQLQKPLLQDGTIGIKTHSDHSLQQPASEHDAETIKALDSSASIERQLEEVFGPNHDGSHGGSESSFLESTQTQSEENLSTKELGTLSEDMKNEAHTNLDERNERICHDQSTRSNPTSNVNLESALEKTGDSQDQSRSPSLSVTSDSHDFENDGDFISCEAQELTQEILEEYASSLGSIGNNSTPAKDTKSEENLSTIDHGFEEDKSKRVLDKSLQTSFGSLSIESVGGLNKQNRPSSANSYNRLIQNRRSFRNQRAVSAGPSAQRQACFQSSERPKSAGLYLERKASSIFIDMSNLYQPPVHDIV